MAERPPVCLSLEVTNRCDPLCTTCPRIYVQLEPPADLSRDLFTRSVGQIPDLHRAVLHGVGELRMSINASTRGSCLAVRGVDRFERILKNVARLRAIQEREGFARPRVSAWLTGLEETVAELPTFVRPAADIGVREAYLQRLLFEDGAVG